MGVEPKGGEGLVDFPSELDGRPVYLCWKLGEPEIQFWHEVDAGFAGTSAVDRRFGRGRRPRQCGILGLIADWQSNLLAIVSERRVRAAISARCSTLAATVCAGSAVGASRIACSGRFRVGARESFLRVACAGAAEAALQLGRGSLKSHSSGFVIDRHGSPRGPFETRWNGCLTVRLGSAGQGQVLPPRRQGGDAVGFSLSEGRDMGSALDVSVGVVGYLALFAGVGLAFVFVNLLLGRFLAAE